MVEVVKKTNLIAVKYESPDPELAARVLTALTNLYLEKHLEVHRPPGAFDFFQQETQQYRKGLTDAEARLVDFTHGGTVVSAQLEKEVALQKLAEFDATLQQTQAAIAETQQRIRVLQEQAGLNPDSHGHTSSQRRRCDTSLTTSVQSVDARTEADRVVREIRAQLQTGSGSRSPDCPDSRRPRCGGEIAAA